MKCIKYLFLFLILFNSTILSAKELKKVTIQLSWFDQFQFAGYYMAKQNGYYKDLGLDVTIKAFEFGLDIPKDVSDGKFDFAVGRETLILDKSKGRDIVALYALFQSTPLVLLSTKKSGISKIDHFKNKKIMTTIDDASEVSIKAMIRSNNIRLEDLSFLKHTHNINDLINKKTDVISAYISKSPFELQKLGIQYNIFDPKTYGFDMYSDLLYTSNKLIDNDIETVLAFKEASLKGWKYAYSNINESVDLIFEKYNSQKLSKDELLYEAQELKKLSYYNNEQLGTIKKEKVQRIYDLYNIMGLIENRVNFNDFVLVDSNDTIKLTASQRNYLNNKEEITYCVIPNAMPYSAIREGKASGLVSDLVEALEVKLQVPFRLIPTSSWPESLHLAKDKKCDILPSAQMTQSRKSYLSFTRPYIDIPIVIITKKDIPFINNLKGFNNINIAVVKGFSTLEILKEKYKGINFVPVNSLREGLQKVESGEVYGQVTSIGRAWTSLQGDFEDSLKISGKLDEKIEIRTAVRKDDPVLLEILDLAISKIGKDDVSKVNNKWIYIENEKGFDYKLLVQILVVISIVIFILLYRQSFLKKMNKELNQKVEEKTNELRKINSTLEQRIKTEVEENLKKDRILAQQSKMAAMGRMIENIAHQWRQPLSVISTGASGLKIKKQLNDLDDEFFYETMDSIIDSSKYLSHTIDDFRFFFKPDNEKTTFDLADVLQKTINLLKSKFNHENIQVITKFDEEIELYGHETELIQVFMNILNNAKDAFEFSSEEDKYIFIKTRKENDTIYVEFRDNAGGIKSKVIDKIFEPYFTTKHSSKGTGIGLYMCDQIISKYMNGRIDVKNKKFTYKKKEYKGALFNVVFEQKLQ